MTPTWLDPDTTDALSGLASRGHGGFAAQLPGRWRAAMQAQAAHAVGVYRFASAQPVCVLVVWSSLLLRADLDGSGAVARTREHRTGWVITAAGRIDTASLVGLDWITPAPTTTTTAQPASQSEPAPRAGRRRTGRTPAATPPDRDAPSPHAAD